MYGTAGPYYHANIIFLKLDVEDVQMDGEQHYPDDPPSTGSDGKLFSKLATFVLGRLTVAHSTAAVERMFSIVSCIKTKQRNQLRTGTLEAILRYCKVSLNVFFKTAKER
jgi:hypothetical protein